MSTQRLKAIFDHFDENGNVVNREDIAVSDISELSSITGIADGSIAWIKTTGQFFAYDGGEWYEQGGES